MCNRFVCISLALLLSVSSTLGVSTAASGSGTRAETPSGTLRYVALDGECGGATPCYASFQEAIDAAVEGDEIRIAAGTYTGVSAHGALRQVAFVEKSLTLRGGFTPASWETPDSATNLTTIDAERLGRGLVIYGTVAAAPIVTVEGLRITHGDATGLGGYGTTDKPAGGGVFVFLADATFRNCTIDDNTAGSAGSGFGGGLAAIFGALSLEDCTIENNRAGAGDFGLGGGVLVKNSLEWGGSVTLSGNTIRGNAASSTSRGSGGGVHLDTVTAVLSGNTVADNVATSVDVAYGEGGGISASESSVIFTSNTVQGNSAGGRGSGGGICLDDVNARLTDNRVVGNTGGRTSNGHGGGLYARGDRAVQVVLIALNGNTIEDNTACRNAGPGGVICRGGGVELVGVAADLVGNTIQGNTAAVGGQVNDTGRGGGVAMDEPAYAQLTGNIIRNNVANTVGLGFGGGIDAWAKYQGPGDVRLSNNSIQGNTGSLGFTGYGGGIFIGNVPASLSSNFLGSNTASSGRDGYGGGLRAEGGVQILSDNTIQYNVASTADRGVGGGLSFGNDYDTVTTLTLTGNAVRNNTGSTAPTNSSRLKSGAGGVDLWLTGGTMSDNVFTGNIGATAQSADCGGVAINVDNRVTLSLTDNTIEGNSASTATAGGNGGGLCASGNVVVSGNRILNNHAATAGGGNGGGAMLGAGLRDTSAGGATTFSGNTVRGNVAGASGSGMGGGLYISRNPEMATAAFTVTQNLIADNVASQSDAGKGGGIYLGVSRMARLDSNTIIGNSASTNAAMTGLGGGVFIVSSMDFSVSNSVIARNRAETQGSGVWIGKAENLSDPQWSWGRFLHTTIADNQVGSGVWLESPLPAGTLAVAYTGGTQLMVFSSSSYQIGDMLLIDHTDGSTRAWRRIVASEYAGWATRLTIDSELPSAFPAGSKVQDAPMMFVDTIIAGHTTGFGAKDQPVILSSTLWSGNSTNSTGNLEAILTLGDVFGATDFVDAEAGDYHIGAASSARDAGIDAGIRTDIDGGCSAQRPQVRYRRG